MFANSLDNKPVFTLPDGTEIKDLTQSMFDMGAPNYISYNVYKIPRQYEMRPDLISTAVYKDSKYAELILKFNGISNPFTLLEGDYILIPSLDSIRPIVSTKSGSGVDAAKKLRDTYRYIDPIKIPKANNDFQNRNLEKTMQEGALPTNISKEGEPQITYRNGRVYFGQGVESCLQDGMTTSGFLTNVIKSRK